MLLSQKISKRQSEVRESLATLAAVENPTEEQVTEMRSLDTEYTQNEVKYRAALVSESEEREEAKGELENRSEREFAELVDKFEVRQIALALDEGAALSGETNEVVTELRSKGGFQGIPVPFAALSLEQRAGETIASGTPDPVKTRPIVDQLFAQSVASRMGAQIITIDHGEREVPVVTQGVTVGWQSSETGDVASPQAFQTVDRNLAPDYTMGAQMTVTRKSMKQSGPELERAIRRDANSAIGVELDRVAFLGSGSSGEPLGIVAGQSTYGIDLNTINAAASYGAFRAAGVEFMGRNSANSFKDIRLLFRHELINTLDAAVFETGGGITEYDFISKRFGSVLTTGNALAAPSGSPLESKAVMTTSIGGVAPFTVALWGAADVIRDPYSSASSGALKLTFLVTTDVTVIRPAQIGILDELQ